MDAIYIILLLRHQILNTISKTKLKLFEAII